MMISRVKPGSLISVITSQTGKYRLGTVNVVPKIRIKHLLLTPSQGLAAQGIYYAAAAAQQRITSHAPIFTTLLMTSPIGIAQNAGASGAR